METLQNMDLNQLKDLIYETVRKAMNDALEDKEALESTNFQLSIQEARNDYKSGNFINLDELDV
jgi:hypothetical protein